MQKDIRQTIAPSTLQEERAKWSLTHAPTGEKYHGTKNIASLKSKGTNHIVVEGNCENGRTSDIAFFLSLQTGMGAVDAPPWNVQQRQHVMSTKSRERWKM